LARTINTLRSRRSITTPSGSESRSQGRVSPTPTSAMRRGSLVNNAASKGPAAASMPSPMFEIPDANH
jgi:hypothetical protein